MTLKTLQEEFTVIAEQREFITSGQILETLEIQVKENTKKGVYRFIVSILYDQGFITKMQINEVLNSKKIE